MASRPPKTARAPFVPRKDHEEALQAVTEQAISDVSDHLAFGLFGTIMQYVQDHPEMSSVVVDKFLGIYLGTISEMHGADKSSEHAHLLSDTLERFADGDTPEEARRLAAISIEAMDAIIGAYER